MASTTLLKSSWAPLVISITAIEAALTPAEVQQLVRDVLEKVRIRMGFLFLRRSKEREQGVQVG